MKQLSEDWVTTRHNLNGWFMTYFSGTLLGYARSKKSYTKHEVLTSFTVNQQHRSAQGIEPNQHEWQIAKGQREISGHNMLCEICGQCVVCVFGVTTSTSTYNWLLWRDDWCSCSIIVTIHQLLVVWNFTSQYTHQNCTNDTINNKTEESSQSAGSSYANYYYWL